MSNIILTSLFRVYIHFTLIYIIILLKYNILLTNTSIKWE